MYNVMPESDNYVVKCWHGIFVPNCMMSLITLNWIC